MFCMYMLECQTDQGRNHVAILVLFLHDSVTPKNLVHSSTYIMRNTAAFLLDYTCHLFFFEIGISLKNHKKKNNMCL